MAETAHKMSGEAALEHTPQGQDAGDKNGPGARGNLDGFGEYEKEKNHYAQYFGGDWGQSGQEEELRTTPLFSLIVKCSADRTLATSEEGSSSKGSKAMNLCGNGTTGTKSSSESHSTEDASNSDASADAERGSLFPQYGLLGHRIDDVADQNNPEPIFLNTNAPVSSFICGSQGSGKSYTLSCMLENCLLQTTCPGKLDHPLGGVVFHYDNDSSMNGAEAARLCSRGIKTRVLVSRSNINALTAEYGQLPGAQKNLEIVPLLLQSDQLTVEVMMKLMSYSEQEGYAPLYMAVVQRVLRDMVIATGGGPFRYAEFRQRIKDETLSKEQINLLEIRFGLLESFLDLSKPKNGRESVFAVQPGTLTVVDLTDPFVDASTTCILFDICLKLFKNNRPACGLVVALDEAHKYMNASGAAMIFTDRLLTTIREQRHNATRVIIATQEPTISEKLMELCSITIVHRFTSPTWFTAIKNHLGGASSLTSTPESQSEMFEKILNLQTGQSLLFSPSSYLNVVDGCPKKLGSEVAKMKTRMRFSADGGKSELAAGRGLQAGEQGTLNGENAGWLPVRPKE